MKNLPRFPRLPHLLVLGFLLLATSCTDHPDTPQPAPAPSGTAGTPVYSSDVVTSWLPLQLRLAHSTRFGVVVALRQFAYTGIALYESIVPGYSNYQSIAPQLNGLPPLPTVTAGASYYRPAAANAAIAAMVRSFNPAASAADNATIDSLEAANTALYQRDRPADELARSAGFGQQIAAAVLAWAKTDGSDNATPFVLPAGAGMWVPTPPNYLPASLPNWGSCRLIVANSDAGTDQIVPVPYSEDPASAYYAQAREVYDISQRLTAEQRATAIYWAINSWPSILRQVLVKEKPSLEVAAAAMAQSMIAVSDAFVSNYKGKYVYTGLRPVTYIRTVLGQSNWNAVFPTPAHPEFPSGHAISSGAASESLTLLFGASYAYTDTPFNAAAGSPRLYASFAEAAEEAAMSRVYAGIHYRPTAEAGIQHGRIIARNVAQKLTFKR